MGSYKIEKPVQCVQVLIYQHKPKNYGCRGRIRTSKEQLVTHLINACDLSRYSPPPRQEGMSANFITLQYE